MSRSAASPAVPSFEIAVAESGGNRLFRVTERPSGRRAEAGLPRPGTASQSDYSELFAGWSRTFGTRLPNGLRPRELPPSGDPVVPVLTENLTPDILYGYGDPWVVRLPADAAEPYLLVVTSNDAPDAFPILRSADGMDWRAAGFAFPRGGAPPWANVEPGLADFWAPEIHVLDGRFILCFAAREKDGGLAIGLATAAAPDGPYVAEAEPLLRNGVIDPHIFVDGDGAAYLFWKRDNNDRWPSLLCGLVADRPDLIPKLFRAEADRRTAALYGALWPWASGLAPMERFLALHVLIEAAVDEFGPLKLRLRQLLDGERDPGACALLGEILEAMRTPIHGRELRPETLSFAGDSFEVIENDLEWEGPLIEGMSLVETGGRYYLFYSGNDFSTAAYGIGYAVASAVGGPYRKSREPLLRSGREFWGPGQPSVAEAPDGTPIMFLHGYSAGAAGYKAFRALLATGLRFDGDRVTLAALSGSHPCHGK